MGLMFLTRTGIVVKRIGPVVGGKAPFVRSPTGGFHGHLWMARLRPVLKREPARRRRR